MIPPIFARAVEEDIWVLGICADYLEDHGKDGSILRTIADNHFLLDDSGYSAFIPYISSGVRFGGGESYDFGDGLGYGIDNLGDGIGHGDYLNI